jgi:hypothetical protein
MMTVKNDKPRRVAIFRLPLPQLLRLFLTDVRTTVTPESGALPADVRIVNHRYDPLTDNWEVLLESDTFDPVPENTVPPYLPYPSIHISIESDEDAV